MSSILHMKKLIELFLNLLKPSLLPGAIITCILLMLTTILKFQSIKETLYPPTDDGELSVFHCDNREKPNLTQLYEASGSTVTGLIENFLWKTIN